MRVDSSERKYAGFAPREVINHIENHEFRKPGRNGTLSNSNSVGQPLGGNEVFQLR